jgi:hypothetical protein
MNNEKRFYRNVKQERTPKNLQYPSLSDITEFWQQQLAVPENFNKMARWIKEEELTSNYETMQNIEITSEDLKQVLKKQHNWKAPGPDGMQNYWYKKFTSCHAKMTELFNSIILDPTKLPEFTTRGITYLIHKDLEDTKNPEKYRPITCLPTIYKIITTCITRYISTVKKITF